MIFYLLNQLTNKISKFLNIFIFIVKNLEFYFQGSLMNIISNGTIILLVNDVNIWTLLWLPESNSDIK